MVLGIFEVLRRKGGKDVLYGFNNNFRGYEFIIVRVYESFLKN